MHAKPFVVLLGALLLAVVFVPQACKPKPLGALPEIGKTMLIKPVAMNATGVNIQRSELAQALYLQIQWGGRPLRLTDQATVEFYALNDPKPTAIWTWEKLANAHVTSRCDEASLRALEKDAEGVALICDGSLPIDSYTQVVVRQGERSRTATSWSTYMKTPEVYAASIQTY